MQRLALYFVGLILICIVVGVLWDHLIPNQTLQCCEASNPLARPCRTRLPIVGNWALCDPNEVSENARGPRGQSYATGAMRPGRSSLPASSNRNGKPAIETDSSFDLSRQGRPMPGFVACSVAHDIGQRRRFGQTVNDVHVSMIWRSLSNATPSPVRTAATIPAALEHSKTVSNPSPPCWPMSKAQRR